MISEKFAKPSELGLSRISQAEIKGLMCGGLVHDLESRIVLQDFKNGAVGLPQELEPWCDNCSIGAILGLFAGNSGKQECFGSLQGLQVFDVCGRLDGGGIKRGLDLLGFLLRFSDFFLGEFNKPLENELQTRQFVQPS